MESANKDNSHSWGQNFSWPEQIGHRRDRQGVRRQRAGDFYNEDGSICVCNPILGRLKQNQEDLPLLADLEGLYLFLKEHGLTLNQELNPIKRTQWRKD